MFWCFMVSTSVGITNYREENVYFFFFPCTGLVPIIIMTFPSEKP